MCREKRAQRVDATCQHLPGKAVGEQGNPRLCFDALASHQIVTKALKSPFREGQLGKTEAHICIQ